MAAFDSFNHSHTLIIERKSTTAHCYDYSYERQYQSCNSQFLPGDRTQPITRQDDSYKSREEPKTRNESEKQVAYAQNKAGKSPSWIQV
jgi:hypothetical protein